MRNVIYAVCITLILSGCGKNQAAVAPNLRGHLDHVVDGATLTIVTAEGTSERVQLIGVQVLGQEANERAILWLEGIYKQGYPLLLTFDDQERDNEGNLLAYVFAGKGTEGVSPEKLERTNAKSHSMHAVMIEGKVYGFVNASLIKGGRAQPVHESRNKKYADLLRELHESSVEKK